MSLSFLTEQAKMRGLSSLMLLKEFMLLNQKLSSEQDYVIYNDLYASCIKESGLINIQNWDVSPLTYVCLRGVHKKDDWSLANNFYPDGNTWGEGNIRSFGLNLTLKELSYFKLEYARQFVQHQLLLTENVWTNGVSPLPVVIEEWIKTDDICALNKAMSQEGAPCWESLLKSSLSFGTSNSVWDYLCNPIDNNQGALERGSDGCVEILKHALSLGLSPEISKSDSNHPYRKANYAALNVLNSFNELSDAPSLIEDAISNLTKVKKVLFKERNEKLIKDLSLMLDDKNSLTNIIGFEAQSYVVQYFVKGVRNKDFLPMKALYQKYGDFKLNNSINECMGDWSLPAIYLAKLPFNKFAINANIINEIMELPDEGYELSKNIGGYGFGLYPLLMLLNNDLTEKRCSIALRNGLSGVDEVLNYFNYFKDLPQLSNKVEKYLTRVNIVYRQFMDLDKKRDFIKGIHLQLCSWEKKFNMNLRDVILDENVFWHYLKDEFDSKKVNSFKELLESSSDKDFLLQCVLMCYSSQTKQLENFRIFKKHSIFDYLIENGEELQIYEAYKKSPKLVVENIEKRGPEDFKMYLRQEKISASLTTTIPQVIKTRF